MAQFLVAAIFADVQYSEQLPKTCCSTLILALRHEPAARIFPSRIADKALSGDLKSMGLSEAETQPELLEFLIMLFSVINSPLTH